MSDCPQPKKVKVGNYGRIGPGPGKYMLPPNVGYINHDFTKHRNPMYSISPKFPFPMKPRSPGPKYNLERMTRVGKASTPAYSLSFRQEPFKLKKRPGPADYVPHKYPPMPCYSMSYRYQPLRAPNYPGPDKYMLPTTLGPKVIDKHAMASYSMSSKYPMLGKSVSPGPAAYPPLNPNIYRQRMPNYSIRPFWKTLKPNTITPGPKYFPTLPECGKPGFSFGHRVDNMPYVTAADELPCI